jgi:hypothetical protein
MNKKWEETGMGNVVLEDDKVKISYNPNTGTGLASGLSLMIGEIVGEKQGEETALFGEDGLWRILEGDFRKEYEEVFPDWKRCLLVYLKNKKDHRSGWSTDEENDE